MTLIEEKRPGREPKIMSERFLLLTKEAELFLRTVGLDHPKMAELAEKLREEIKTHENPET